MATGSNNPIRCDEPGPPRARRHLRATSVLPVLAVPLLALSCAGPGSAADPATAPRPGDAAAVEGRLPALAPEQVGAEVRSWVINANAPALEAALRAAGAAPPDADDPRLVGPAASVLTGNGLRAVIVPIDALPGLHAATVVRAQDVDLGLLATRASAPGVGTSPQEALAAIPAGLSGGVSRMWVDSGPAWRVVAEGAGAPVASGTGGGSRRAGRELAMHDSRFWAGSGPVRLLARCYPMPGIDAASAPPADPNQNPGSGPIWRGPIPAVLRVELLPQVRDDDTALAADPASKFLPTPPRSPEREGQLISRLSAAATLPANTALVLVYAPAPADAEAAARAELIDAPPAPGTVVRDAPQAPAGNAALGPAAPQARPALTIGHELLTIAAPGRTRPAAWRVVAIVPSVPPVFAPLGD